MQDVSPSAKVSIRADLSNAEARITAALVVAAWIGIVGPQIAGIDALATVAHVAFLAWFAIALPRMRTVELLFAGAAGVAAIAVVAMVPRPGAALSTAIDRGALFLAFVATLNVLRDAAQSSSAVRRAGLYLVTQSPPRRYAALTLGGHVFGIILNMGVLPLLTAMVRRANTLATAGGDPGVVEIRERRMITALLRGFGATIAWSPLSVSVGYTLSLVPSLTWFDVALPAFAMAATWMVIGWILDRLQWPAATRRGFSPPQPTSSPAELLPMLGITGLLVLGVIAGKLATGASLLVAVMGTVPFMAFAWIGLQHHRRGLSFAFAAVGRRFRNYMLQDLPLMRPEAVVLACSGFLGVALTALTDAIGFGDWLGRADLPPAMIASAAFLSLVLLAQIGITPLITATFIGTTITQMEPMPISPLAVGLAVQTAWSLASATSPFTGGSLVVARLIGKRPFVLQRWNLPYAAICAALAIVVFFIWL